MSTIINLKTSKEITRLLNRIPRLSFKRGIILFTYFYYIEELDKIFNDLTRDFCINQKGGCGDNKIGCCQGANYLRIENKFYKDILVKLQKIESKNYVNEVKTVCKYHNMESGCMLKLTKTPICISFLCYDLIKYIKSIYKSGEADRFLKLIHFGNIYSFDIPYMMLERMEQSINEGKKLLSGKG